MEKVYFHCPKCSHEIFKINSKPERLDEFNNAICPGCGYRITENDIETQLINFSDEVVRELAPKILK